jgi:hypothetical protein
LDKLRKYLDPIGKKDVEAIIALKSEDYAKHGLPVDDNLHIWDSRYIIFPDNYTAAFG